MRDGTVGGVRSAHDIATRIARDVRRGKIDADGLAILSSDEGLVTDDYIAWNNNGQIVVWLGNDVDYDMTLLGYANI